VQLRFIASKLTTVAASVAIFSGVTAWIAAKAADRQPQPRPPGNAIDAPAQPAPGTPARRPYVVQRIAPDGTVYFETVSSPPAARPAPVTRTRAS